MNIYQQSLLEGLRPSTPDEIPNSSEILALLHLVIPSSDTSNEMPWTNSYNPIEDPFVPQSPDLSLPITSYDGAASADLTELIISHNVQLVTEPLFDPAQSWIEAPTSFIRPGPAFSVEVPQPDHVDAQKLIELFEDTNSLQDKNKEKSRQQELSKKPKGKCEVAGCNTKMQSKGKCIRHGGGRRCVIEGCTRGAQTMRRCKRHGGGARCKVEGCGTSSQGGGLCRAHGGGKLCTAPGCKKGAQRQGKCATHSSQKCRVDDCFSVARCRGFCSRHKRQATHIS